MPHRSTALALLVLPLVALLGCDSSTAPEGTLEPPRPGVTVISGSLVDTVEAPIRRVTVEVRDSAGRPEAGIPISISVQGTDAMSRAIAYRSVEGESVRCAGTTDAEGRACMYLVFYRLAGEALLHVDYRPAAAADWQSTNIPITVLPGGPAAIRVQPRDTALYPGGTAPLRFMTLDRFHNVRPNVGTLTATSAEGLTAEGQPGAPVLRAGPEIGRYKTVVRVGAIGDTAYVSVVPRGEIAVRVSNRYGGAAARPGEVFAAMQLDGSGWRPLLSDVVVDLLDLDLVQVPGADAYVFQDTRPSVSLYRFVPGGAPTPIVETPLTPCDRSPTFTADGRWVYFSRRARWDWGDCSASMGVYRTRADGSGGIEKVFDLPGHHDPAVSPDGRWVTYSYLDSVYVREVATGATRQLTRQGWRAQWSPDGALIAYETPTAIKIVRPDGTEVHSMARRFAPAYGGENRRLGWSPDGKWLVGVYQNSSDLIEVATGRVLPLAFTMGLVDPVWLRAR
jgi:hypothetical protein